MPEVSWQARRTTDNVLVDVTADVDGLPQGAPVGNPIEGGATEQTVLSRTVTLTDAQIKALPSGPVILVAATETLGYSGTPSQLVIPLACLVVLDNSAGAYTNVNIPARLVLTIGSDWSSDYATATNSYDDQDMATPLTVAGDAWLAGFVAFEAKNRGTILGGDLSGAIEDNAVGIALTNGALGALTGGNAANTMKVTVLYTVVDL